MLSLCLSAGSLSASLAIQAFTLAWMHSIEKVRWEEDWLLVAGQLHLVEARIKGSGAGMEPPPGAVLRDGFWHYRPAVAPLDHVNLAHSPYTKGYELCLVDGCRPLAGYLPGIEATAVIVLEACRE
ncbi:MAG: hypothetical protein H6Q35_2711 [Proteobacteria bacterium]|nr:hypothetical protein [Pseudomonadota bacterium]MBS1228673.1 hypothetical protein [Pseudomonadota bacterium]